MGHEALIARKQPNYVRSLENENKRLTKKLSELDRVCGEIQAERDLAREKVAVLQIDMLVLNSRLEELLSLRAAQS